MARDGNFVCRRCDGNLVEVKRIDGGRVVYNCDRCHDNECQECTVCHFPRAIWADDGDICGLCAMRCMHGEIRLTEKQAAGIKKWMVII